MRKNNFFSKASLVAAMFFVVVMGFVSCSEQVNLDEPEKIEVPVPGPKQTEYIEVEKKISVGIHAWYSEGTLVVNGNKALTASVTPDSTILKMLVANHKVADITDFLGDNRWKDSNGNAFTGVVNIFSIDGLKISAYIEPAEKFSTITKIHSRVSMVKCLFYLKGFFELQLEDGKIDYQEFELPIEVTYFLSDPSVDTEYVDREVIKIQYDTITVVKDSIVYKDSIQYVDRVEYVPVTEYIHVNHSTNEVVTYGLGYADIMFAVDDQWLKWHAVLDSLFINRNADNFGKAKVTYSDQKGFTADDMQKGNYTSTANGMEISVITSGISFDATGDDNLKTATVNIQVAASFTDTDGETKLKTFQVKPFYFHKSMEVKAEPSVVTPEITTEHTYTVDSVRSDVKDSEGNLIGQKMRITVTREDGKKWKIQYLAWETGLLSPTITGTQVGGNSLLRATSWSDSEYTAEGWSGVDTSREGFTITATSKEYKFRTPFPKVPGFGGSEESVAESNIVFGTRSCTFTDPENTSFTFTISADGVSSNETSVKIVEDQVGTDEAAKAEVNGRGLQYEYCGTHFLSVEQYVGGKLVLTQSRAENLLYPKN